MQTNYQIVINKAVYDRLINDYKQWKQSIVVNEHNKFIVNWIDEFLKTADISTVITTKYTDFEQEVYVRYIAYVKNQIYKILPLAEEKGEWRKHLDTLILELTGFDKVFLHSTNLISLINKLETLKQCPDFPNTFSLDDIQQTQEFKLFRKTIFECMNIAENLAKVGDI